MRRLRLSMLPAPQSTGLQFNVACRQRHPVLAPIQGSVLEKALAYGNGRLTLDATVIYKEAYQDSFSTPSFKVITRGF
jgi:hypothetical protein